MSGETLFPLAQKELDERERFDWLRLSRSEMIGPRTFLSLLDRYRSASSALAAVPDLARRKGRPIKLADTSDVERECEALAAAGGSFIALCEPDYPPLLRLIDAPPPIIAVRGRRESLARAKVAIVGARNASAAGLVFTERLSREIAKAGYVIVSGLARGIDAKAHQAALETGTIAVLAGGLGRIYPAEHAPLLERLLGEGAAISEMPFHWEARGRDFPRRNRIVSGLSLGLVVVEAARQSGSLITARFAADQGRQIFAVPGSPLDPRAEGPNDLLQEGATFCTKPDDVIDALANQRNHVARPGFAEASAPSDGADLLWDEIDFLETDASVFRKSIKAEWDEETVPTPAAALFSDESAVLIASDGQDHPDQASLKERIIALLGPAPVSVDELARAAASPPGELQAVLLILELEGRLTRHGASLVSLLSRS